MEPLAQRLRPRSLDEVCGQQHRLGKNQVFRRTVESGKIPNMIFYGPSGVGKTTVASIIAAGSGMQLHKLLSLIHICRPQRVQMKAAS